MGHSRSLAQRKVRAVVEQQIVYSFTRETTYNVTHKLQSVDTLQAVNHKHAAARHNGSETVVIEMQRTFVAGCYSNIAPCCCVVVEGRIGITQAGYNPWLRHWQKTATGHSHIHYIKTLAILHQ